MVDAGSKPGPVRQLEDFEQDMHVTIVPGPPVRKWFCKPILMNLGISAATGDLLSFVDCDAIVGPKWLDSWNVMYRNEPTVLFYRVRTLPRYYLAQLLNGDREMKMRELTNTYHTFDRAWEGYGPVVHANSKEGCEGGDGKPVYGNSQLTITRENLGDLRYDEEYVGAGFEDLAFIRSIVRKFGCDYVGHIMTDAAHAMIHIHSPREKDWGNRDMNRFNHKRYLKT